MHSDPIRTTLLPSTRPIETATDILRMLTSDRVEPVLRCRADGGTPVVD